MSGPRVLISSGLVGGGVKTHLLHLVAALKAAGADVTLAAALSEWPAVDERRVRDYGARLLAPSALGRRWPAWAKAEALTTWPVRLPRDFDTLAAFGSSRMHFRLKRYLRPGGFTVFDEPVDVPVEGTPGRAMLTQADGIIAMAEAIAANMRPLTGGRPVRALPYLIAAGPTPPPAPRPPAGNRELRVAFLGRVTTIKRPDWLVREWPRLLAHAPLAPARLDIYGPDQDGLAEQLRDAIRATGQGDTVAVRGPYAAGALPAILAVTDIVVLPSQWEGLPLVLAEAMTHGVPFVATAAGGTTEFANPDVEVVGLDLADFPAALARVAGRVRAGAVDAVRLWDWAEGRYGHAAVAAGWVEALLRPREFFAAGPPHQP